jgi:hypothetical protein
MPGYRGPRFRLLMRIGNRPALPRPFVDDVDRAAAELTAFLSGRVGARVAA